MNYLESVLCCFNASTFMQKIGVIVMLDVSRNAFTGPFSCISVNPIQKEKSPSCFCYKSECEYAL